MLVKIGCLAVGQQSFLQLLQASVGGAGSLTESPVNEVMRPAQLYKELLSSLPALRQGLALLVKAGRLAVRN